MSPDQQAKLFQAFTQADVSMTRKFGGTGLGLLLSKRLAQALGGDVTLLESQEGQGSTFLIHILAEIVQPPASLEGVETLSPARPQKLLEGICVLLADDGADMQALIGHILRRQGAQVEIAENGQEAVERAMAQRFDVVLMDLQMPVCDGFQATLELRRRGYEGPVIAVSAAAMMLEKEKSLGVGCDEHISKPVNVEDLVDKVARYSRPRFLHSAKKRGGRSFDRSLFN
jgi:CheY-like chemotaxis protein